MTPSMITHHHDVQSVRRVFDWPLVIQTLLFIGSIFGIAIYSENRITKMEQTLIYHGTRMERIERIEEKMADAIVGLQRNQDQLLAYMRQERTRAGRGDRR